MEYWEFVKKEIGEKITYSGLTLCLLNNALLDTGYASAPSLQYAIKTYTGWKYKISSGTTS